MFEKNARVTAKTRLDGLYRTVSERRETVGRTLFFFFGYLENMTNSYYLKIAVIGCLISGDGKARVRSREISNRLNRTRAGSAALCNDTRIGAAVIFYYLCVADNDVTGRLSPDNVTSG